MKIAYKLIKVKKKGDSNNNNKKNKQPLKDVPIKKLFAQNPLITIA